MLYGIMELIVALITIYLVIQTVSTDLFGKGVGLLGAIYILVRGLDSIDISIKDNGRSSYYWNKLFRNKEPLYKIRDGLLLFLPQ